MALSTLSNACILRFGDFCAYDNNDDNDDRTKSSQLVANVLLLIRDIIHVHITENIKILVTNAVKTVKLLCSEQ